jgi:hypothetical protein
VDKLAESPLLSLLFCETGVDPFYEVCVRSRLDVLPLFRSFVGVDMLLNLSIPVH